MLSPGTREAHRQAEEFVIAMKTLGVRETRRMMLSCMHASDRPTADCWFSSDGEEISEIHWICGEDAPDPDVQIDYAWLVCY
jgi:hypothetical protein